jgi:hypothetical protein
MLTYRAPSHAAPDQAWALLARPGRWHEWAPHLRGAWGLGEPEVRVGARGAARLLGVVPVPAVVTDKRAGRSWTWRVGPVDMVHAVRPSRRGGCDVVVEMHAPAPVEALLSRSYGPLVGVLVRRLAQRASG